MREFGQMPDGTPVAVISIAGEGIRAEILSWGATIHRLVVDAAKGPRTVTLGLDRLEDYLAHSPFFGSIVGRCANRIRGGHAPIDGKVYQLGLNEAGRTHLHGGAGGFWNKVWTVAAVTAASVTLELVSPDGEEGYPGTVTARATYRIDGPRTLSIDLEATSDAATLVNLATHSYFRLDDGPTVLGHLLEVPADRYTPVDEHAIPTGERAPIEGTRFDLRKAKPVGDAAPIDHNLIIADAPVGTPRPVARLTSKVTGLRLTVASTEPGLQVYDGSMLVVAVPLAGGEQAATNGAICLEPQRFPDAVHHPDFAGALLRPGETYTQLTRYIFDEVAGPA